MEQTSHKGTAARRDGTADDRPPHIGREALASRLRARAAGEPVPRRRAGEAAPLSHAQERLWFLDQLEPGSAAYNIARAFTCRGRLDAAALAASLTAVACRHESLRTTFAVLDGRPVQIVAPPAPMALPVVDLAALPSTTQHLELERLGSCEAARPFDLARGPLLRSALVRSAPEEHTLLLTLHHIVADGWSLAILVRELGALYTASVAGRPSPMPELAVQYADWAARQRERLAGQALERLLASWRERLAGAPAVLALPHDRPRPAVQTFHGARRSARLPEPLATAVRDLGAAEGATLFMTLLAGVAALLGRWSDQEDVVVGAPVAGRLSSELEPLIGFFANTLPLRVDLAGEPAVRELVARVRRVCLEAYAHQELPLERLVEELNPERSLAWTPLFQVTFALQNAPAATLSLPGLTVEPRPLARERVKFDLSLDACEAGGGIDLDLWFDTDLFEAATAERLLGHLATLLAAAMAHPERRVSELPLLTPAEREQVLGPWAGAATGYPREATIDGLFGVVAAADPEAVAIACGAERVSYGELARRASRLARHLRALGLGPEAAVALGLERSVDSIVGMLGALAAGACYVPLDPAYPRERLAWMLADAGVAALLVRGGSTLVEEARARGCPVVDLDRDAATLASYPGEPPAPRSLPGSLAYVMYTSGSTGAPKGVAVPHRAVVRLVRETWYARFGRDEVFLHLAPASFDAATLEVWGPLLNGGRLAIPPGSRPSLAEIGEAIARHGVTTLWLTAGLFHQVVDEHPQALTPLRRLLAGGDVLSPAHVRRALELLSGGMVVNGYGPTENTTFTCCHELRSAADVGATVPIGRPIANTRVHIVSRGFEPTPVGVPGELLAGGDGLARGYLGRPELTAERFVPDPFGAPSDGAWSEPGSRLYRTGDLARWRADGAIEFLGRLDAQVKVRGFRIEPGEIEAALAAHPRVREAVVAARPGPGGDKRLVAWVVLDAQPSAAGALAAELRRHLGTRLPDHMVPSAFVPLPELPLTPNGKVDRRALPEPAPETAAEALRAPRTPTEELVAGLWADLLGRDRVGLADDFFALGGHSLLATRLVARLRGLFGVDLPLRALFEAPTVEALAAAVEAARRAGGGDDAPPLLPRPRRPGEPLPLSFAQERLWFLDRLEPGNAAYNVPLALAASGRLDVAALAAALAEVARRHEALRTTFGPDEDGEDDADGAPAQRVGPAPDRDARLLPTVDLSGLAAVAGPEADRLVAAEARRPFDLARGPVCRAALLRLGEREHLLSLGLHHIACDGWSLGVLFDEVAALYGAFAAGRPSPLAALPVQYADWAAWQREWLCGERLAAEIGWWRERLAGAPAALELPLDRPRPASQSYRGGHRSRAVPEELARAAATLARREGATPFMVLLAAFQGLLSRVCGADDLCVGTPVAGRARPEVEGLIGFFVNTLVLRAGLADGPSFRLLLARARESCLDAWAHQELPFERLVEALAPERHLARTPLVQVLLALDQTTAGRAPDLSGLRLARCSVDTGTSKLDLSLAFEQGPAALAATVVYSADLFDGTTAERLLGHLLTLLAAAVEAPERQIAELPLLSPAERQQLLAGWGDGGALAPDGRCLHEVVAARAARTPDAVALITRHERLTYRELTGRAGRLAAGLRALGVGPEILVAVCTRRDADMVAGLLAVLEAGGAYVPLDPAYPAERLALTLEDAGAEVLLTRTDLLDRLPPHRARVVLLDDRDDRHGRDVPAAAGPAGRRPAPADLAYVIYTSGSTGTPKGVAVTHGSAVAFVDWALSVFPPGDLGAVFAGTSICFDLSVFELFATLAAGGTVVLGDDPLDLAGHPAAGEVTLLNTVPSAAAELVRLGAVPPSARTVNLAGEPLRRALVDRLHGLGTVERVFNLYGPSEDTTYSTWALAPLGVEREPTIGRPIAGTRAYVVDRCGALQPVGVPGELWLGGAGLARGYLGRPELTAERFVPDPFAETCDGRPSGARAYRTGDLARWRPSGELEFLGRIDHQVKVRGFRIELGEIEAALLAVPGVREAVAMVREDGADRALVAWAAPAAVPAGELRAALARRLPGFMVPSAIVVLPELPHTPNGKVDRKALPAPERPAAEAGGEAPRSAAEELVAGIWCGVLGLERVGRDDDFFACGGHSLLGTRVVSRVRGALGVELPLRALFEAPTVAGLAARIEAALREDGALATAPPIVPVPRDRPLPLSFSQERQWFLDRLDPGSPGYDIPLSVVFAGRLRLPALRRGLDELVRRHESLRTRFPELEGGPVQLVEPALPVPLPVVDLGVLPAAARQAEARRIAAATSRHSFDLARGPLFLGRLLRLAAAEHTLCLVMHHIVSDGWSIGVLLAELAALYEAFAAGRPSPLPEPAVQYADFAVWQRRWLTSDVLAAHLDHWRRQLGGVPALQLPTDRPRPVVQSFRGTGFGVVLPAGLLAAVRDLARRESATLFMTLLAAWKALLGRWSGQRDFAVGTFIANRNRAESEGLIGFFVNNLALRADLGGERPAFRELLARARRTTLDAYAWQDLPFEKVIEAVQPERDLSRTPIFQVMLVLQNAMAPSRRVGGLAWSMPVETSEKSNFDLTLWASETEDGLRAFFEHSTDLFDTATVRRLAGHFEGLLAAAAADPDLPLADLPLATPAERHQTVHEWMDTRAAFPQAGAGSGVWVHDLFEPLAARAGHALAVSWQGESLTYAQVDRCANRLARHLRALGAGPDVPVALFLERSLDLVPAVLGVMKSGAAYVPLDTAQAPERLAAMLEGIPLVVTTAALAAVLPRHGATLVRLDADAAAIAAWCGEPLAPLATAESLAYVVYTSGSTGKPKGVMIPHSGLTNACRAWLDGYELEKTTAHLQMANVAFDVFSGDLVRALGCGAKLVLCPRDLLLEPEKLYALMRREGVDCAELVPAVYRELVRSLDASGRRLDFMRMLVVGSDVLYVRELAEAARFCAPGTRVVNSYGVSEATIDTSYFESTSLPLAPEGPAPIGRCFANQRLLVLDETGRPAPVGVHGELFIGGAGGARGYLGRPDSTAEKFVPDPWGGPGARLYRTGDRARFLADGNVEFLGRVDFQIKVRGFRVEPGEIEMALAEHPAVGQAVVVARGDHRAGDRLVAYLVLSPEAPAGAPERELREHLKARLPDYMIPSAFVTLDRLPLTANGKVDRRSLPAPDWESLEREAYVAPRNAAEEILAGIWEEVLGIAGVGVRDDFFALGGHSLLATQVVTRLRSRLDLEMPVRTLFEAPTIEELALVLEELLLAAAEEVEDEAYVWQPAQ